MSEFIYENNAHVSTVGFLQRLTFFRSHLLLHLFTILFLDCSNKIKIMVGWFWVEAVIHKSLL